MTAVSVRLSAEDIREKLVSEGIVLYRKAAENRMTVSQLLAEMAVDPGTRDRDAFDAQLELHRIRTESDPARGLWADSVAKFYATDSSKVLFPEFINRTAREALIAPPITAELIALTSPCTAGTYTAYQIEDQPAAQRMARVTEYANLPRTRLKGKDVSIKLWKFGRVLEASYEFLRRVQIPMLRVHLQRIGMQTDLDRAEEALDVIINGDGNGNAAENWNVNTLDATAGGKLTNAAWLAFLMKFFPHRCTTVIADEASMIQILTLQFPNVNPLTILALLQSGQSVQAKVELAQDIFVTVRLVLMDSCPANKIVGIDRNFAIEQVVEVGADITETERVILGQFERVAISETLGFSKILTDATKTLTLGA